MEQTLLVVDRENKILTYATRALCHTGRGKRHRAFVTLLFNSKNEVLLQRRKHRLFDGFWDLTAISHPLHLDNRDESWQEASDRALKKEMGIGHVEIKNVGAFNYYAKDGKNCENEYCAILIGNYDGKYKANQAEVYESKWLDYEEFAKDIKKTPKKYTPWAILAAKRLKKVNFDSSFEAELKKFLIQFNLFKKTYFAKKKKENPKIKVAGDFWRDLEEFMESGKKLRAFLVYMGYLASGGRDVRKILPASLAYEIVHSFLLMHDDVIDRSDLRRGKPTIHKKYAKKYGEHFGESMAILWGDVASLEAISLLNQANFDLTNNKNAIDFFVGTIITTAYGETIDVANSHLRPTEADIKLVNILKTAKYSVAGPLILGAIFAGAKKQQISAFSKFGLLAGEAFQLQDDLLGVFGSEKTIGKSILSDMREGKNTLLIYKSKELAKKSDRIIIDRLWGSEKSTLSDLFQIRVIIRESGAYSWYIKKMQHLKNQAILSIRPISAPIVYKIMMQEMTEYIIKREV